VFNGDPQRTFLAQMSAAAAVVRDLIIPQTGTFPISTAIPLLTEFILIALGPLHYEVGRFDPLDHDGTCLW